MIGMILNTCVIFIASFIIVIKFSRVSGHGRLLDPPARGTMWRLGFDTPPNYNDHELNCGGYSRQWKKNKGRCGVCGDPWDEPRPRPNESGGIFGTGLISRVYREGEEITVTVHLTANHLGWFEFRICANDQFQHFVTQKCLNENALSLLDRPGTRFEVKSEEVGLFRIKLKLPEGVTCSYCVLQWHYTSGNNWGFCEDGKNKVGCGPQEVFRGCADIAIFSYGDSDYYKFDNLTRKIDYENFVFLNPDTGFYNDRNEDPEDSSETDVEKIFNVESDYRIRKPGWRGDLKNRGRFESKGYRSSGEDRKNKMENNFDFEEFYEEEKFKYPNYFPDEDHSGNYIYSKIYISPNNKTSGREESPTSSSRRFLLNILRDAMKHRTLKEHIKKKDEHEKPKISDKNITENVSKIITLLLSIISSSSSLEEANNFLDTVANILTLALEQKTQENDV
ncbi:UNVERIFIED_CONTAM: hypothetical protein RMT77_008747 [Armadillidium vulgare]